MSALKQARGPAASARSLNIRFGSFSDGPGWSRSGGSGWRGLATPRLDPGRQLAEQGWEAWLQGPSSYLP